ncbi:MAG: hypothetical protein AAF380_00190 [Bacteroidota bacterium]
MNSKINKVLLAILFCTSIAKSQQKAHPAKLHTHQTSTKTTLSRKKIFIHTFEKLVKNNLSVLYQIKQHVHLNQSIKKLLIKYLEQSSPKGKKQLAKKIYNYYLDNDLMPKAITENQLAHMLIKALGMEAKYEITGFTYKKIPYTKEKGIPSKNYKATTAKTFKKNQPQGTNLFIGEIITPQRDKKIMGITMATMLTLGAGSKLMDNVQPPEEEPEEGTKPAKPTQPEIIIQEKKVTVEKMFLPGWPAHKLLGGVKKQNGKQGLRNGDGKGEANCYINSAFQAVKVASGPKHVLFKTKAGPGVLEQTARKKVLNAYKQIYHIAESKDWDSLPHAVYFQLVIELQKANLWTHRYGIHQDAQEFITSLFKYFEPESLTHSYEKSSLLFPIECPQILQQALLKSSSDLVQEKLFMLQTPIMQSSEAISVQELIDNYMNKEEEMESLKCDMLDICNAINTEQSKKVADLKPLNNLLLQRWAIENKKGFPDVIQNHITKDKWNKSKEKNKKNSKLTKEIWDQLVEAKTLEGLRPIVKAHHQPIKNILRETSDVISDNGYRALPFKLETFDHFKDGCELLESINNSEKLLSIHSDKEGNTKLKEINKAIKSEIEKLIGKDNIKKNEVEKLSKALHFGKQEPSVEYICNRKASGLRLLEENEGGKGIAVISPTRMKGDQKIHTPLKEAIGIQIGNKDMKLVSGIIHSGKLEGGHYTSVVYYENEKQWYKFNDEEVTQLSKPQVEKELRQAYVLFYKQAPAN